MDFERRVMRVMTHLNIGLTLGLVAWLAWSSVHTLRTATAPLPWHPDAHVRDPAPSQVPSCCSVRRT